MGFRLVPTSVTLNNPERPRMTLNNVIALILSYFIEFDSFFTVVEDRPVMYAEYCLPVLAKTDLPCSAVSLR